MIKGTTGNRLSDADFLNNIEMVHLTNTQPGRYTVIVRGAHLPSAEATQPYALVLSASFVDPVVLPCDHRPCVQGCSGHGTCAARGCVCTQGWSGIACGEIVLQPSFSEPVVVSLLPLRWKYIRVVAESPIRQLWVQTSWNQIRTHQYTAVYISHNRMPTAADFDFVDRSALG